MPTTLSQQPAAFDRSDTKAVKGVAILMMLFHHLAGFPYKAPLDFPGFKTFVDYTLIQDFATASKLCVSVFLFLGGYGLYKKWKEADFFSVSDTVIRLFKAYWKVYFIFVPIAFLFFRRSGADINSLYSWYVFPRAQAMITRFLSGIVGITDEINGEWWFLKGYICLIPLGYLFCQLLKKCRNFWGEIFCVFFLDALFRQVIPGSSIIVFTPYLSNFLASTTGFGSLFFAGIVFAKYDGLCNIKKRLLSLYPSCAFFSSPVQILMALVIIASILWSCAYILPSVDIFYCALLLPALSILFDRLPVLKKPMVYLGKHSTNIWLIHSFYCYYFLEAAKIVYCTTNLWIDLAILLAMSLASSIAVNFFWEKVGVVIGKFTRTPANF